ncbi:MAG: DUF1931 domain-containing protein [Candidatus Aenigmarchaeota archaeon]|nr:DUF1931 domain-containing protein [Candidatus Aenigmarchaeota archaeon]
MADARMVVRSAVRESLKGKYNVSEEFLEALDTEVSALVKRAARRAEDNGRRTLKARDT